MKFPDEPTIKFFGKLSKLISLEGKKGLDIGCGIGRNCRLMYEFGIEPYGIEISEMAVKRAQEYQRMKNFKAKIKLYDGKLIPFKNNYFDFVISHGVLDHILLKDAKRIINEIFRVLKDGGYACIVVHSSRDTNYGKGIEI